ncbi:hypothetical protein L218DRAFT_990738 [Marasmius fiardii PR-910]|nr:hypothetical protein L218DRAFT_990738 [Marasmius fiardii PR-910]
MSIARRLLLIPRGDLDVCYCEEMDLEPKVTAREFIALIGYHRTCSEAIQKRVPSFLEWPVDADELGYRCSSLYPSATTSMAREDLEGVFDWLKYRKFKHHPYAIVESYDQATYMEEAFGNGDLFMPCRRCRMVCCTSMVGFVHQHLRKEIEDAVDVIKLGLSDLDLED